MKKISFLKLFVYIFLVFSLSSCKLIEIIDSIKTHFDDEEPSYPVDIERPFDVNTSLLDEVFNGKVDFNNNSLLQTFEEHPNELPNNTYRSKITKNATTLDVNSSYCPSTGDVNGLVIPVDFVDAPAKHISFTPKSTYQSVSSFYYNSSYGKLNMSFDVVDWVRMPYKSTYYENMKPREYKGDAPGASAIILQALSYLEDKIDLTKYDNNDDGIIDCLYIIYSTAIDADSSLWWAFQYSVYENNLFDGLYAGNYVFAGYEWCIETANNNKRYPLTYIHETAHLLGLDDYYDYDNETGYNKGGLGGADMMDYNMGDHNPFSKMALGWIDKPIRPKPTTDPITITIDRFDIDGDVIMICEDYDSYAGIFQDYFLIVYIDPTSYLNNATLPYDNPGIKVYRIHGETQYFEDPFGNYEDFKYDNSYTEYNLIDAFNNLKYGPTIFPNHIYETICANDGNLFFTGDVCDYLYYYDSSTTKSEYSFKVDSIDKTSATITIFR